MPDKLLGWVGFNVVLALLPVLFDALVVLVTGSGSMLSRILGQGGLLLLAVGLCSAAFGNLLLWPAGRYYRRKVLATVFSVILISSASLCYGLVANLDKLGATPTDFGVVGVSMLIYLCAIINGGACVLLAER